MILTPLIAAAIVVLVVGLLLMGLFSRGQARKVFLILALLVAVLGGGFVWSLSRGDRVHTCIDTGGEWVDGTCIRPQ